MDDSLKVAVLDATNELAEVVAGERLREACLRGDLLEELAAGNEFHDHEDLGLARQYLMQADNVLLWGKRGRR